MKKILLLLAKGFEVLEASALIDVIGWNQLEGDGSTLLLTCGLCREIRSSFNQRFLVDVVVEEVDTRDFHALAIPGGFEEYGYYEDAYNEKFLELIRAFRSQGKPVASVCVGSLSLGRSGILQNKKGTTYFKNPARQTELRNYGVHVLQEEIVIDDGIITSRGPSTAVEVAFVLLGMLTSKENANQVRMLMGFESSGE
jgi:protein deglycase